jgi:hypothetical protein
MTNVLGLSSEPGSELSLNVKISELRQVKSVHRGWALLGTPKFQETSHLKNYKFFFF